MVKSANANLARGIESVGGTLTLTDESLTFEPHGVNLNRRDVHVAVGEIERASTCRAPVLGVPVGPTGLHVRLKNGDGLKFTVRDAADWSSAIDRARPSYAV